jgi:CubicO group peptidase (beta-lactamase class C family)
MSRFNRIALVALLLCAALAPRAAAQQALTLSLFERYADALRVQAGIPGMSGVILQNGRVVWDKGFGVSDLEHSVPTRSDTPYQISGLTETLTSTLLLEQCYETGHLSLDDTIQRRAIAAPDNTITIRDALTHRATSGSFKYDTSRFTALTGVVETCMQKDLMPFRQALAQKIFDRFIMFDSVPAQNVDDASADDRTQFTTSQLSHYNSVLSRMAVGYRVSGGNASSSSVSKSVDAASGAISTALDLAKFDSALDAGDVLHRDTMAEMWTNAQTASGASMPTGLGWFVQNYNGRALYWQFGNIPGAYSSLILKVPSQRLTLILLANSDGLSAPFSLQDGDVTNSLFARTFLKIFVG